MTLNTIPDIEVIEHLDFDHGLPCESRWHDQSPHSGIAEFMQYGACPHTTGLRCGSYSRMAMAADYRWACDQCGIEQSASDLRFVPISAAT